MKFSYLLVPDVVRGFVSSLIIFIPKTALVYASAIAFVIAEVFQIQLIVFLLFSVAFIHGSGFLPLRKYICLESVGSDLFRFQFVLLLFFDFQNAVEFDTNITIASVVAKNYVVPICNSVLKRRSAMYWSVWIVCVLGNCRLGESRFARCGLFLLSVTSGYDSLEDRF